MKEDISKEAEEIIKTLDLHDMDITHATVVNIPIYKLNIILVVNNAYEKGAMTSVYGNGSVLLAIPLEMIDGEVIPHEVFHATIGLCNYLGLECEESKAYLNGYINETCLNYFGNVAKDMSDKSYD